jgi:mannosyltransferase
VHTKITSTQNESLGLEFDDLIFSLQAFGGISEYWREITTRMERDNRFRVHRIGGAARDRMRRVRSQAAVFHSSHFRAAVGPRVRNVTTVHDMAYEKGYIGRGLKGWLHRLEHKRAYFSSDLLICVSENTRRDLLEVYPALRQRCPITVIHHGVTPFDPGNVAEIPDAARSGVYLIFVGKRGDYKNFITALEAMADSRVAQLGVKLLCTGTAFTEGERVQIQRWNLKDRVISLGNIDRRTLGTLYRRALGLLYPSLFEGFGMPILEAMQEGCPVLAANATAVPEIAGDAALLVDGHNAQAFADGILQLRDAAIREYYASRGQARAARFTWEASAAAHAQAYIRAARL